MRWPGDPVNKQGLLSVGSDTSVGSGFWQAARALSAPLAASRPCRHTAGACKTITEPTAKTMGLPVRCRRRRITGAGAAPRPATRAAGRSVTPTRDAARHGDRGAPSDRRAAHLPVALRERPPPSRRALIHMARLVELLAVPETRPDVCSVNVSHRAVVRPVIGGDSSKTRLKYKCAHLGVCV